ncbi:hypothetical protein R6Q59_017073 [Mikania micrantha]
MFIKKVNHKNIIYKETNLIFATTFFKFHGQGFSNPDSKTHILFFFGIKIDIIYKSFFFCRMVLIVWDIYCRTKLTLTRWSADWKNATQYYEQAATAFRFAKKHEKAKIAFEKASKGQEMISSYPF